VAFAALAALVACANDLGPHPNLPVLGAFTDFLSTNLCSEGVSPEIRLGGVPANTASYRLLFTNVSVLSAPRWQVTLRADSPVVPAGAIEKFEAPCPGELLSFNYRLEVMALDGDQRPLAYGWTFASARSLTKQIEREQVMARTLGPERSGLRGQPGTNRPHFFIQ